MIFFLNFFFGEFVFFSISFHEGRIPQNRHLQGRVDRRTFLAETTVEHERERAGEVDEGRAENNKEGVLCGSNDTARETNDKMRTRF